MHTICPECRMDREQSGTVFETRTVGLLGHGYQHVPFARLCVSLWPTVTGER